MTNEAIIACVVVFISIAWLDFAFRYKPSTTTKRTDLCDKWRELAQDVHLDLLCIRHGTHKPSDLDLDHLAYWA